MSSLERGGGIFSRGRGGSSLGGGDLLKGGRGVFFGWGGGIFSRGEGGLLWVGGDLLKGGTGGSSSERWGGSS